MSEYGWVEGARVPLDAQVAGECLEKVRLANGGQLTAEAVVSASIEPSSPLYAAFEWNNKRAANLWRLEQARYIIRSIVVSVTLTEQEERPPIRAFVNVTADKKRHFTSISVALSDPDLRVQVLEKALSELNSFRKRYEELSELAGVFKAIDEMER